jgi:glycosyltransferase involved in cell wall biosynthesis
MSIPNKIIDAISMGKPILTSLHGEVEYLIDKHKIGLSYRVDSKRTLYDCLKVLISDNELLNAMSRNAINLYNSKFSYEIVYGRLVKHLEEMATKNI